MREKLILGQDTLPMKWYLSLAVLPESKKKVVFNFKCNVR